VAAPGVDAARVMQLMRSDKKFRDGRNRFVLPVAIGEWKAVEDIPSDIVACAVEEVLQD
jgi:3-dehydroquinate synthetase